MKKINTLLMCLAAAAMTFTACSDVEEFNPNANAGGGITFVAGNPGVTDTRTEMELGENGKITPLWSKQESMLLFYTGGSATEIALFKSIADSPRQVAEFVNDQEISKSLTASEYAVSYISGMGNYGVNSEEPSSDMFDPATKTFNNLVLEEEQHSIYGSTELDKDILISRPFNPSATDFSRPVKQQYKRLNGVICLNIKDNTADRQLTGKKVEMAVIATDGEARFAGRYGIDAEKGEIIKAESSLPLPANSNGAGQFVPTSYINLSPAKDMDEGGIPLPNPGPVHSPAPGMEGSAASATSGPAIPLPSDNSNCIYIIGGGDELYGMLFCSLPTTVKSGENLVVTLKLEGGIVCNKTITVDRDFLVESGKITRLNVSFDEKNLIDQRPIVTDGNIEMQMAGTLTPEQFLQAANTGTVTISGPMNSDDFASIKSNFNFSDIMLQKIDLQNVQLENNTIKNGMINGWKVGEIILPANIAEIETEGIFAESLRMLVIPKSTKMHISAAAINIQRLQRMVFLSEPSNVTIDSGAFVIGNPELILNRAWEGNMNGTWGEYEFTRIAYTDVNDDGSYESAKVNGSTITTTAPGQIGIYEINEMMYQTRPSAGDNVVVKIVGDINIYDLSIVNSFLSRQPESVKYTFSLDLSKANIKGTGTTGDNVLMKDALIDSKIIALVLPETLTSIEAGAIQNCSKLMNITLGLNINSIAAGAINTLPNGATIKCVCIADINNPLASNTENVNLKLNTRWNYLPDSHKDKPSGNSWKGCTWKSISFVYEDGTDAIDQGGTTSDYTDEEVSGEWAEQ